MNITIHQANHQWLDQSIYAWRLCTIELLDGGEISGAFRATTAKSVIIQAEASFDAGEFDAQVSIPVDVISHIHIHREGES